MGTSYKALLRAFVITSAFRGFTCCLKVCLLLPRGTSRINDSRTFAYPTWVALFIDFGLIGKGIHTCRRTFEFFDIWLSATLRSSNFHSTLPKAFTICYGLPRGFLASLRATLGSGSCVFPEFFSLLVKFSYCELSTVRLFVVNGSNPSIIYTRFMS